jgi:hypothetical protein
MGSHPRPPPWHLPQWRGEGFGEEERVRLREEGARPRKGTGEESEVGIREKGFRER